MPNITPAVEDVYVNDRGPYGQGVYISSYFWTLAYGIYMYIGHIYRVYIIYTCTII